jgi:GcrA cell cycle regulator
MRSRNPPWTTEDNERLKGLVAQGASVIRAAAALNRSIMGVRHQARKIGCPFPPLRIARQKWADTPNP